jgi:hypothetical protein
MFTAIYRHELTRHLCGMPFYLFSVLLFISAFAFLSSSNMDMQFLGMALGAKSHNAPTVLAQLMARLSIFGSLFAVFIVGQAVVRDFEHRTHDAFFTLGLSKWQYLGGRFFGSVSAIMLACAGLVAGAILGCLVHPNAQYGPFEAMSFLMPLALIMLPNMLFTGSLFFAVATLTRRIMPAYLCAIGLILSYVIVTISLALLAPERIRVLADPFAIVAIDSLTQFWTLNDINQRQLPVFSSLLVNRMIWLSVTVLIGIFTYRRFSFVSQLESKVKTHSKLNMLTPAINDGKSVQCLTALNDVATSNSFTTALQQLAYLVKREAGSILCHPIFIILTGLSLFDVLTNFIGQTSVDGDNQLPLTINYLKHISMAWGYMLPMTIFFAASLVWKQRDAGIHPLFDVLPVPRWVQTAGVLLTVMTIQMAVVIAMLVAGLFCQWFMFSHTQFELALYFKTLFGLQLPSYWFIAVMAVFIQILSPGKNSGIALSLLFFIANTVLFEIYGWPQPLLNYGTLPDYAHSVFGGFGPYSNLLGWYLVYWFLAAAQLVMLCELLWRNGDESSLRQRIRVARQTLNRKRVALFVTCLGLLFTTGQWISYNRYQLNDYLSPQQLIDMQVNYEKHYKDFAAIPQLSMSHMEVDLALYPDQKRVHLTASYQLKNKTDQPVDQLLIHFWRRYITNLESVEFSQAVDLLRKGDEFGVHHYQLKRALQPGEKMTISFELSAQARGFTDNMTEQSWITKKHILLGHRSGNPGIFPTIGYSYSVRLPEHNLRRQYGLSEEPALPDAALADRKKMLLPSDIITMNSTVSTSAEHTVIANGQLTKQWQTQGRNHYQFSLNQPALNEVLFISGHYAKATRRHNDVELAVYYHPKHPWNVQRMLDSAAQTLEYAETKLTSYTYPALSIVEIPDYPFHGVAPTLFPWRESAGFTAQLPKQQHSDKVFDSVSDAIAHQWWSFTSVPQYAKGALTISGLSKYTSMMVSEQRFGRRSTLAQRKKLRLNYLKNRQHDRVKERPLTQTQFNQDYLSRTKASLAFYAMQYFIGEEHVNKAFRQVLAQFNIHNEQHLNIEDLLVALKTVAPMKYQQMITDWFEHVTLYDVSVHSVSVVPLDQHRNQVQFTLATHKSYTNADGEAVTQALDEYIPVKITNQQGKTLYTETVHVIDNKQSVLIIVEGQPELIQVDPDGVLLESNIGDNQYRF